jgi:flagellar protein FlbD
MITLHRLNDSALTINCQHIETIEETPDSVITLTNDRKYVVKEKKEEIVKMIKEYYHDIYGVNKG